jgi:hypothetical protein
LGGVGSGQGILKILNSIGRRWGASWDLVLQPNLFHFPETYLKGSD